MKKNRKHINKEKKNLRREKERILKMKLNQVKETSIHQTPLKIDGTGNITRLINKKGSVLTTETKMYGCDIEKSVPQFLRRFVDKILGLEEMKRVPIRTKGLTGSGKKNECHQNVLGLVKRFGGQQLRGYMVNMFEYHHISLVFHTVWITPEGKCVDVTSNSFENIYPLTTVRNSSNQIVRTIKKNVDTVIRKGDKEYILFIPLGLGFIEEMGVHVYDVQISRFWETEGFIVKLQEEKMRGNEKTNLKIPINRLDKFQKKFGCIDTHYEKKNTTTKKMKELVDHGGFSQKSLVSGKSWDELKSEIVW